MPNSVLSQDLLIEIGCEELPSKSLQKLQTALLEGLSLKLKEADLSFKKMVGFATPRRLAVQVLELATVQPTRSILKKGPARVAAFDKEGNPTTPALKFAESCKVPFEKLTFQETDKGSWLVFEQQEPGLLTEQLLPKMLMDVLNNLPINKRMRWGDNDFSFVRPVHWIVLLFGDKVIDAEIFGIKADRYTRGHRFHHPKPISINKSQDYEQILLKTGYVIADFNKRREKIATAMQETVQKNHYQVIIEPELLDEVTGLVEWPVVLTGEFDKSFLEIPKEALISSMQVHQKCFPITDLKGNLLQHFLIISNIESIDPKAVINGNNWVMKARLADAAFYYKVDKEITLHQRSEKLKQVVFQAGLGSLWDKSERIAALAKIIAEKINADAIYTERAALLCKADLLTQMVGEFPELQGTMGRYYALHHSEPAIVAQAIEEHYFPRFAQDGLPDSLEGAAVALADRIDSLVGIFGLGKEPTGDKDPFGLRRQALGILRIIIEKELNLDLEDLFSKAIIIESVPKRDIKNNLLIFCFDRLKARYLEQGIAPQIFEAVRNKELPSNPLDFHKRIQAVAIFKNLPEAETLAAANKRVKNILSKSDVSIPEDANIEKALLTEKAETELSAALISKEKEIEPLVKSGNYTEALKTLAALREPVDQFFTDVMVMVEDEALRNNRLRLLNRLRKLFLEIADISLL
jgi:glycyl-tRNA synthetase beta chain